MSNRSDTCTGHKCPFFKRYGTQCPNYVVGQWATNDGHIYDTMDCAPKRSMILCQQIYDQQVDTRKDYNDVRNVTIQLLNHVAVDNNIIDVSPTKQRIEHKED